MEKRILFDIIDNFHAYDAMGYEEVKDSIEREYNRRINNLNINIMAEKEIDEFFKKMKVEEGIETEEEEASEHLSDEIENFFKEKKEELKQFNN